MERRRKKRANVLGKQKISILHACTEEGHGIRFKNTLAFESFDMSLRKKKHLNVQNEYLRKRLLEVDDFLDVHYIFRSEKKYQGWLGKLIAILDRDETEELASKRSGEKWSGDDVFGSDPESLKEFMEHRWDNSFSVHLLHIIEFKNLDPIHVYKKAGIDRKLFSKIKTTPQYIPSKKTALALVLALELSYEEAQFLLGRAGYHLSNSILTDVIVEFFIRNKIYDFDEINAALYAYKQPVF